MTRRILPVAVASGLLVALGACSEGPRTLPPPSSTSSTVPETTTTTADFSTVPIEPVPGETTTTFVATGDAVLSGVVSGPDGALPGAIVRADRLVGDGVQPFAVRAFDDGTWLLEDLPGGRYRVRAYLPPDLTMVEPVVFYLRNDENREVPLTVRTFRGLEVLAGTTPETLFVGDAVSLAVSVMERYVDEEGVGRLRPRVNVPVRVRSSGWREIDEPVDTTDENGMVVFTYECDRVTPVTATAIVGQDRQQFPLDVPDCEPEPTTTTASTTTTTTTATTSTTRPVGTSTTTTTTTSPDRSTTTTEDDN